MDRLNAVKNRKTIQTGFFLLVFIITFFLTAVTPLVGDDFSYAFSWAGGWRVRTFEDLWLSMSVHRNYQHGRVFSSGWSTIFMMGPKWYFNLANALMITVFAATLLHYFQRERVQHPLLSSTAVLALYWVCMPAFGQVFLWLVGSTNYFWGTALAWFLLEAEFSLRSKNSSAAVKTLMLLPLAFAVGAWSEHISFAAIVIQFLFLIKLHVKRSKFPFREWIILIVTGLGYCFLMLSPTMMGAQLSQKAENAFAERLEMLLSLISRFWWAALLLVALIISAALLLKRIPEKKQRSIVMLTAFSFLLSAVTLAFLGLGIIQNGFFGLISSTPACFFLLVTAFFFGFREAVKNGTDRETIVDSLFLFVGGLSSLVLFVLGAQYFPARGFCAFIFFTGIATVRLWSSVPMNRNKRLASVLLCVCFLVCFLFGVADIIRVHNAALDRDAAISEALKGDGILYTSPYPQKTRFSAQYGVPDLQEGAGWPNAWMCLYYELNDIHVTGGAGS